MKKWILIIAAVLLLAVVGVANLLPSYSAALSANWGISLPAKAVCTEAYTHRSEPGFHGDGFRYHVFSYKNEEPIAGMLNWRAPQDIQAAIFSPTAREAADAWLNEINVPEDQRPDYAQCSFWYQSQRDNSEIVLFWNPEADRLYIVESFL